MVEYDVGTQVFLKLSEKASCESWMLLEVCGVKSPLVLEERVQVLGERCGEPLKSEPFCKGCLESKEVTGLAWVEGAVHIGIEEDAEMWWQCELIQSEYVVVVGHRCGGLEKKCLEMRASARKI